MLRGLPPQGGELTEVGVKVEPSLHWHWLGSTAWPQVGMLYLFATDSATTSALKVAPLGQVQVSGRAPLPQGLPWFKSRKLEGWNELPLVQTQLLGSSPGHGLRSLLRIRSWITGLLMMFLTVSWRLLPPPLLLPKKPPRREPRSWGRARMPGARIRRETARILSQGRLMGEQR